MFLHIGDNTDIFINDIVMLINLPALSPRDYPESISLSGDPKTLIVTNHNGCNKYYLSGIRVSTLKKRIANAFK